MTKTAEKTGHCLCGATSFFYDGVTRFMAHCHCESCRRATASAFTSFLGVPDGHWRWTGQTPASYASSPGVTRSFCATCGSQMAYRADKFPGEIHFYAATLTDQSQYAPTVHVHSDEMVPWISLADALPRH